MSHIDLNGDAVHNLFYVLSFYAWSPWLLPEPAQVKSHKRQVTRVRGKLDEHLRSGWWANDLRWVKEGKNNECTTSAEFDRRRRWWLVSLEWEK